MNDRALVTTLYNDLLLREPESSGLNYWVSQLEAGTMTGTEVADAMLSSSEFQSTVGSVMSLYNGLLLRSPDPQGLTYWVNALRSGASLDSLAGAMQSSTEYQAEISNISDTGWLNRIYQNFLERIPAEAGTNYWLSQLEAGMSREEVLQAILASEEGESHRAQHLLEPLIGDIPGSGGNSLNEILNDYIRDFDDTDIPETPIPPTPPVDDDPSHGDGPIGGEARYHYGASDASAAIAIGQHLMLVGDDEDQTLRLYDSDASGTALCSFDLNADLGLESGSEIDIESVVDAGDGLHYWLGSISSSQRSMIFATRITGDTADSVQVEVVNQYAGLYDALMTDMAARLPEIDFSSFEVEGAAYLDGTLYLGSRAPIDDEGRALMPGIENIDDLLAGNTDIARFIDPLRLDLGGRTIRDMRPAGDDSWLIIGGPSPHNDGDESNDNFQLYRWDGAHAIKRIEGTDLQTLADGTGGSPEAIGPVERRDDGSLSISIVYDNGVTDWRGDGTESKDLPPDQQRFASIDLDLEALPEFTLDRSDIAPVALDTDSDALAFVALDGIAGGTRMTITSGDDTLTWTAPAEGVAAGAVISTAEQGARFDGSLTLEGAEGDQLTFRDANGTLLYRIDFGETNGQQSDLQLPADTTTIYYSGITDADREALLRAIQNPEQWQSGVRSFDDFTVGTGFGRLPVPENPDIPDDSGLTVSEIWPGQEGSDITADWFEIVNNGDNSIDFVDTPLYYDDDSASAEDAVAIKGLGQLLPGERAIVMVDGDESAADTFREAWQGVDLTDIDIGWSGSAAGLGSGGDQVTLWRGNPLEGGRKTATTGYPDTVNNDGASWDAEFETFTTPEGGGIESTATGGDSGEVPAVATPGYAGTTTPMPEGGLLISEYVEGSSRNKAIELTNLSGGELSLEGYQLTLYSNGNTEATATLELGQYGSLASGDAFVISNDGADSEVQSRSDANDSSVINFNGNDAIMLTDPNGEQVDIVGTLGDDSDFAKDVTLRRDDSITRGSTTYDESQWQEHSTDTFDGLQGGRGDTGGGDSGGGDSGGNDDNTPAPPAMDTLISAIQGREMTSDMKGQRVSVEAIVTMDSQNGLDGFFLQEEDADSDGDDATSEGIFVYLGNSDIALPDDFSVGDRIALIGTVGAHQGKTQLTDIASLTITGKDQALPAATQLSLPVEDKATLSAYEGMRVSIGGENDTSLTVTDTYELGRYGSVTLSSSGRLKQFTEENAPDQAGYQEWLDWIESRSIIVDDASSAQNPEEILFGRGGNPLDADNTLRGGDTIDHASGVLDFAFQQWRLQNDEGLDFQPTNSRPRQPDSEALGDATLKVASFNVLNYFRTLDQDGNTITTPGGIEHSPRGANSDIELTRQQQKLIEAINESGADVVGLNEIANDGYGDDSSIAHLVAALNTAEPDANWQYITPRDDNGNVIAPGSDAIAVGLIYRSGNISAEGNAAINTSGAFANANRAPMLQTFRDQDGELFSVAVNHFKSKGSVVNGEEAIGDGQGNNNPTRTEAAEQLADWIATDPTASGDDDVLIIGDLNSYAMEDPVTRLQEAGYNLLDDDYSYSYDGQWGSLDHALANDTLFAQVTGTTCWHINADEPIATDYNTEYKTPEQTETLYDDGPFRSSDHDPVIVGLDLGDSSRVEMVA